MPLYIREHDAHKLLLYYKYNYENLLARYIQLKSLHNYTEIEQCNAHFAQRYMSDYMIFAQVLGYTATDELHEILLDVGVSSGIHESMCVVYKNILVGRVIAVYPYHCKVMLISDPRSRVSGMCLESAAYGIFHGGQKKEFGTFEYVSHLESIDHAMMIISSGEGLVYPRGFGIGLVDTVHKEKDSLYYTITVRPIIDFSQLRYCYVLEKGAELKTCNRASLSEEI
jgi:rod shape-determining protein MreC